MALVTLNLKPTDKQLREFGEVTLCMLNIIGLLMMWIFNMPARAFIIFCIAGVAVFLLSRISVKLVKPVYVALIVAAFPIGWVVSHLVMAIFYYIVITGIGLIFKLLRRDPLNRKYDKTAGSYWTACAPRRSLKQYFNQF